MHELGIVCEVIKIVDAFAHENRVSRVEKIVLEIGQLSQAIPRFIEECYPAAIDGTSYENTELVIETLPANGRCSDCGQIYNVIEHRRTCPNCNTQKFELISGEEFNIKEILGY